MTATRFTELVGCRLPIQQAGMGAVAPPALVAAVSEAGGLGMLGTARGGLTPATLAMLLDEVRSRTSHAFGVNFLVSPTHLLGLHGRPPLDLACIELAARAARVVEFFYGDPDPRLVDLAKRHGTLVSWQVGSRAEAIAAEAAGCDLIVAQGQEAGGHVRGTTGLFPLLAEVLEVVRVPVLAAGGIGTARCVAAALAAGAEGVRIGTRFITAREANAHPRYVEALITARAEDTIYTGAFAGGWPDAPHRVLRSCLAAAEALTDDIVAEVSRLDGSRAPVPRLATGVADATATGHVEAMSLWAGQSVGAVRGRQPAAEILRELAAGLPSSEDRSRGA
ncbi:NAD(P)H-dependent flavin oxidoreductase [Roseicella aerolata]|uniref:Nitronate monooxygenase n=1 Tax=Roseicella aerolata TaxID=2883479 RepID=A0A9X1IDA2_9PROT|nr:nitronate monooxygenase [Roseicella aerolata]